MNFCFSDLPDAHEDVILPMSVCHSQTSYRSPVSHPLVVSSDVLRTVVEMLFRTAFNDNRWTGHTNRHTATKVLIFGLGGEEIPFLVVVYWKRLLLKAM